MPGLPLIYDRAPGGHIHACQAGQHGTFCGYSVDCWTRKENTIGVAEKVSFLVAQRAVSILREPLRNPSLKLRHADYEVVVLDI